MTAPTLTYGQGFLNDCGNDTGWSETESGLFASLAASLNDIFRITGTCNNAGDEYAYYEKDITNISTNTYPYYVVRWKTSAESNGLQAKIAFIFTAGDPQIVTLGFSTTWKVSTGTLTAGRTLDKIRIYADDNPDSLASGIYDVYFDFIMICKYIFTFPSVSGQIELELPNVYADLHPPGRVGDISQYLGMNNPLITLNGKIDVSTTGWGTPYGEYLYYVWREACADPFQWFTSDLINCKVTPRTFYIAQNAEALRDWRCTLQKYDVSSGAETTWANKQWFGL